MSGAGEAKRGPLVGVRTVAPSILSADFARLGEQVDEVLAAGAKAIHVDVMDGHFVPPITFGPVAVEAIAGRVRAAGALIDVHLMIERPERHVADFIKAGADSVTVHFEATPHVHYALQSIREAGCGAGLAINPGTPTEAITAVVADDVVDLILCMSVNPGWANQKLIGNSLARLARLREMIDLDRVALEVDGGVNLETAATCVDAGAHLLVAGSAIFGSHSPAEAFAALTANAWTE